MIPQPQGFTVVLEPVDRDKIEELSKKLGGASGGFGQKTITGYDNPCLMRVVAAGTGVMYEKGFISNHIGVGDEIVGTITELSVAKDFLDPKEHWEFDGKKYVVARSRDYYDITGPLLFVTKRAE